LLAIFDVEGVLYDAEYLPTLARTINKEEEIWAITKKGIQGSINWEEGLTKRIELLKGIDFETCKQVADSLPIMPGARKACKTLKDAGWKLMAVSGGFTIMTDRLKDELNLDHIYANELIFKDGKLDGVKINVDSDKAKSARVKIEEWNIPKDQILVIVDGANDIKLFDICNLGIAYCAQELVKNLATTILDEKDLTKIIPIINEHFSISLSTPAFS